jgi:hypothetical protein
MSTHNRENAERQDQHEITRRTLGAHICAHAGLNRLQLQELRIFVASLRSNQTQLRCVRLEKLIALALGEEPSR